MGAGWSMCSGSLEDHVHMFGHIWENTLLPQALSISNFSIHLLSVNGFIGLFYLKFMGKIKFFHALSGILAEANFTLPKREFYLYGLRGRGR